MGDIIFQDFLRRSRGISLHLPFSISEIIFSISQLLQSSKKILFSTLDDMYVVKLGIPQIGTPSDSFIFDAMEVKYELNPFAIARLSNTNLLSIINEGDILSLCFPRRALIKFHVFLILPFEPSNCLPQQRFFTFLIIYLRLLR